MQCRVARRLRGDARAREGRRRADDRRPAQPLPAAAQCEAPRAGCRRRRHYAAIEHGAAASAGEQLLRAAVLHPLGRACRVLGAAAAPSLRRQGTAPSRDRCAAHHRPDALHAGHGFMDSVRGAASASWPPEAVHVEHFGADAQALAGERHPFELQLGRSGRTLQVPQDRSIADVLNGNGVPVVTSCREGVCGSCVTGVLEGRCDHRDVFLSDKERARGDRIMVCVSRASGPRLVLDL
ncbi:MAG: 2Fe-2S iron-sulfur cluster binding domain-containing protein [Betaproteobacteria bacterium]|nr:MAG: 2Fe-2S iron-sulfur cluster binding domain-containing protein [Betaproteobacteria bacterium]